MSKSFPVVIVKSERPDMSGKVVCLGRGKGVIMDDDPTVVYVSGDNFYGAWPIEETNVTEIIVSQKRADEEALRLGDRRRQAGKRRRSAKQDADEEGLRIAGSILNAKALPILVTESKLISGTGIFKRVPTLNEFAMSWDELEEMRLVE